MSDNNHGTGEFYITRKVRSAMGTYHPRDEEMHPEFKAKNASIDLNETQYFGFSVPEARIHSVLYAWAHPNLDIISTGVMVAQGIRHITPAIDIHDYRAFVPMSAVGHSYMDFTTPGHYHVEVIEPGVKFRTTYHDEERDNHFDVLHTAMFPPCVWSSNVHLEQVMKTDGEVTIRGKRHVVDGTHVRDRSWGEERPEMPRAIPPVTWMTGVFEDGFCFHATAVDSPSLDPVWKGHFPMEDDNTLRFGWVIVDGEQAAVVGCRKRTHYDSHFFPQSVDLEITDERGRTFRMKSEMVAGFCFNAWHNCRWPIAGSSWVREDGVKGWGDVQDGQWSDFLLAVS